MKFREPDVENCRREAPKRIESIKKFEKFVYNSLYVSQENWYRTFDI